MRAMTEIDVDEVLRIEREVQAYPWSRGNFMDALSHGYVCQVDTQDAVIRGYAVLMADFTNTGLQHAGSEEAELLTIGVAATQQRKGLGRAMLREMLEAMRAKNLRRVFLEVRASNLAALALYRSAGFTQIGVRRGYYQNAQGNEDAVTMMCDLGVCEPGECDLGECDLTGGVHG